MKITPVSLTPLLLCLSVSLLGCKKAAEAAQTAAVPALAVAAAAPAKAAAKPTAAPAFDLDAVPESSATIPPFPYLDYPKKVDEAFQSSESSPLDKVYVIAGKSLLQLEGKVATRTFPNDQAEMSELEIRRSYESALKALGGVKVSMVAPDDAALVAANGGDDFVIRKDMLRIPETGLSYDVYLIRRGPLRHWIALMVNGRTTRLLAVEEKAFVQTVGYVADGGKTSPVTASGAPAVAAQPVNLNAIPATAAALPPFPYLAYPPKLDQSYQETNNAKFDAAHVIVGKQLRAVEGRVATRTFPNTNADMSAMALRRNYEAAIKGLGGVKVNAVAPEDPALVAGNGDEKTMREARLRIPERNMSYDSYLIRAANKRVWIALMINERRTRLLVIEEKDFEPGMGLVTAAAMGTELAATGRVALYVNFDTDKATIRADGKPTVGEIAALLKKDPALKLTIEGHTDNQGDARHNKELSKQRAHAVAKALTESGIDGARLSAIGHGAEKPITSNADEAGRAKNRRVELVKVARN